MNLVEIRRLVKLVEASQISELEIEEENSRIRIIKKLATDGNSQVPVVNDNYVIQTAQPAVPVAQEIPAAVEQVANYLEIKSPMVGTFYRAPSPEAPSYVQVGDRVKPGQVLCIIEAMKLMNEIECEVSGMVKEISIDNAQPVEFDQVLFKIEQD